MKKVNIRQFQQNMYKYLVELPLCITKYNRPNFYIVRKSSDISGEKDIDLPINSIKASVE